MVTTPSACLLIPTMTLAYTLRQFHRRAPRVALHPDYVQLLLEVAPWTAAEVLARVAPDPY